MTGPTETEWHSYEMGEVDGQVYIRIDGVPFAEETNPAPIDWDES